MWTTSLSTFRSVLNFLSWRLYANEVFLLVCWQILMLDVRWKMFGWLLLIREQFYCWYCVLQPMVDIFLFFAGWSCVFLVGRQNFLVCGILWILFMRILFWSCCSVAMGVGTNFSGGALPNLNALINYVLCFPRRSCLPIVYYYVNRKIEIKY